VIEFFVDVAAWFADPEQWAGSNGIPARALEHLWLSVFPTVLAALVAIPPAVVLAHRRLFPFLANALVNIGRAIPSFGILVVGVVLFITLDLGFRFWPIVIALVALAIPPIFTNAYTAIADVPDSLVEAARGMGFREGALLRRIELPVAAPVILAGVEISLVQVVATVPLAAIVTSGGGFGQYIVRGFAQGVEGRVEAFAGALLVALFTLLVQRTYQLVERLMLPPGIRWLARQHEPATPRPT